jgi:hypothetical protein
MSASRSTPIPSQKNRWPRLTSRNLTSGTPKSSDVSFDPSDDLSRRRDLYVRSSVATAVANDPWRHDSAGRQPRERSRLPLRPPRRSRGPRRHDSTLSQTVTRRGSRPDLRMMEPCRSSPIAEENTEPILHPNAKTNQRQSEAVHTLGPDDEERCAPTSLGARVPTRIGGSALRHRYASQPTPGSSGSTRSPAVRRNSAGPRLKQAGRQRRGRIALARAKRSRCANGERETPPGGDGSCFDRACVRPADRWRPGLESFCGLLFRNARPTEVVDESRRDL